MTAQITKLEVVDGKHTDLAIDALVSARLERGRALSKVNSVYEVFGAA